MKVNAVEQELLRGEVGAFAAVVRDPMARAPYLELLSDVREGEIRDALLGHLANVLEISLQSGRLRQLYGPDGEQALASIFRRTPTGMTLSRAAGEVSEALTGLEGGRLDGIRVSALGPGSYSLTIDTDRCQVNLRMDRSGVRIENVAIGI